MTKRTSVNGDDFAAALNDERTQKLASDGIAYVRQLRTEGRDHSMVLLEEWTTERSTMPRTRIMREVGIILLIVVMYGVLGTLLVLGATTINPWLGIPVGLLYTFAGVCEIVALENRRGG